MFKLLYLFILFQYYLILNAITNGNNAMENQFPYIVIVETREGSNCMGNFLNDKWILSAAHCLIIHNNLNNSYTLYPAENLIIKYGSVQRYKLLTKFVDFTIIHINFEKFNNSNSDIGLIRLKNPTINQFNSVVSLPTKLYQQENLIGTVSGFGRILSGSNQNSYNLKWIYVKIVKNDLCEKWYSKFKPFFDSFCAYGTEFGDNICKGDSGTGLIIEDYKNNTNKKYWIIIGIASFVMNSSYPMQCENYPALYVNVYKYRNWILKTMREN